MVYDIDMIRSFYSAYKGKMERVRSVLKRPLTLAEKILYTHLFEEARLRDYKRGRLCEFSSGSGSYAGCYCTDGSIAVYECR